MNYDRILLELLDRVAALENEVAEIKGDGRGNRTISNGAYHGVPASNKKDTSRYLFKGHAYGKNRLVLAVVQAYAAEHAGISASELIAIFDKRLQGSLGVVRRLDELKARYPDYQRRFFLSPDAIIHTSTGDCVVCTQWAKFNIDNFIRHVNHFGLEDFEIKML